jgi:hypothetical protein
MLANLQALYKIHKSKAIELRTKLAVHMYLLQHVVWLQNLGLIKRLDRKHLAFERKCFMRVLSIYMRAKIPYFQLYESIQPQKTICKR